MTDILLGIFVSISLLGIGIFLLLRDPAKQAGSRTKPNQLRQAGMVGIVIGILMAVVTVYVFLKGVR
jgi:dipeptide/tripeptide permease